jgi:hypothetical protein
VVDRSRAGQRGKQREQTEAEKTFHHLPPSLPGPGWQTTKRTEHNSKTIVVKPMTARRKGRGGRRRGKIWSIGIHPPQNCRFQFARRDRPYPLSQTHLDVLVRTSPSVFEPSPTPCPSVVPHFWPARCWPLP